MIDGEEIIRILSARKLISGERQISRQQTIE
jgi:hypothetical protein